MPPPNGKVIPFPKRKIPNVVEMCWNCHDRPALPEPWACGLCDACSR